MKYLPYKEFKMKVIYLFKSFLCAKFHTPISSGYELSLLKGKAIIDLVIAFVYSSTCCLIEGRVFFKAVLL
jgi:hypothetical protein